MSDELQMREVLQWIAAFADIRSQDDSRVFARVNRAALRTIRDKALAALATYVEPPSPSRRPIVAKLGALGDIVRKYTVVGCYPNTYAIAADAFELGRQAGEEAMKSENAWLALLAANGGPVLNQLNAEEQEALVDFIRSQHTLNNRSNPNG